MEKLKDYLRRAAECSAFARTRSNPQEWEAIAEMAAAWQRLAEARLKMLQQTGRIDREQEHLAAVDTREREPC
jgi:hypothetical protein